MGSVPVVHSSTSVSSKGDTKPGGSRQASVAAYIRGIPGYGGLDESAIDAYLLTQFPGRTLEELDGMDWVRYNRALHARSILESEEYVKSYKAGKIKAKDISPQRWERIRKNDEILYKRAPP